MKSIIIRLLNICVLVSLAVTMIACSNQTKATNLQGRVGILPYPLTDREATLLYSLGIDKKSNIVSFKAPNAAKSIEVNTLLLNEDGTWEDNGGIEMFRDPEYVTKSPLEGTLAMLLKDNYVIEFNLNTAGKASFQSGPLAIEKDIIASTHAFLTDYQAIELNKEIPVALMVYDSGTSMRSYTMEDYANPSVFAGMDVVQVVTIKFSDEPKQMLEN